MLAQPKKIASPLSRKAVLVAVNISQWTARKLDREVTKEVNDQHAASQDAGRYNKLLIEQERLAKINELVAKARKLHYRMTRPWADDGPRILPNVLFSKFADEFRVIKRDFDDEANTFAAGYPRFIEERKAKLNGMFKASDYPSAAEIRSKFELSISVLPFPDAEDFRVDLDDDVLADIKAELAQSTSKVFDNAMKHTAQEIVNTVGNVAEQLKSFEGKDKGGRLYESLIGNVRKLVEVLPAFNFDNDPAYDNLVYRIEQEVCREDVAVLKENETVRKAVRRSAEDIVKQVEAFFG